MLDLAPEYLDEVRRLLAAYLPDREVWAFGSRVSGKAKPFSDLDLVVMGDEPLDFRTLSALKDAFAESNLPFRVDVVEWATTDDTFRSIIRQSGEVLRSPRLS
ncbi:nucleotidyltransferase domain-containing protein [bacterium]|nr:nucleotidyltransferase domain-containing protein [bacterium]